MWKSFFLWPTPQINLIPGAGLNFLTDAHAHAQTGFMQCFPNCHNRKQWAAKNKISIYVVKVKFF
jgi:hypothetical protein